MTSDNNLPRHIAIIMDGNGRWAKRKHLPLLFGHRAGAKTIDIITQECAKIGIEALTLYAFSAENWKRSKPEVDGLMNLLYDYLNKKLKKLQKNNIRLNAIGRLEKLPLKVRTRLYDVMKKTSGNTGMVLSLALNYGSRQEITDAVKELVRKAQKEKLSPEDVNEDMITRSLYTKDLPDVDLLIRTSGEFRLSNFLLWQLSYSEIAVTKTLWPDFNKKDLTAAIEDFQKRDRRFGGR